MKHQLYASIDKMLALKTLTALEGQPVTDVRLQPFQPVTSSASGNHFLRVETVSRRNRHYLLKRISPEWDFIMRGTADRYGREVVIWQRGLLDRLPAEVTHSIVACAVDGPGWAILMRDISAALIPNFVCDGEDIECILEAMAALHAAFWEAPSLADSSLGLCSPWHRYICLSPRTWRGQTDGQYTFPRTIMTGWELLETLVEPDVTHILHKLHEDPQPLCDALSRYPQTLVHGDFYVANLGLLKRQPPQISLLDWQVVTHSAPAVDLTRYIAGYSWLLPISKETAISCYKAHLARRLGNRFNEGWWQPQLELALLGSLLWLGWSMGLSATHGSQSEALRAHWRAELPWWSEQARAGARWL